MLNLNLDNNAKKIHFIGIGGISMSGLAEMLHKNKFIVSGSDSNKNDLTNKLESIGIKIFIGHSYKNIEDDLDIIVHTAAIKNDNPEILAGKNKNIKIIDRAELLGMIIKNFKYSISVTGTHGKTTTTSMISKLLIEAKKDPTISVGGIFESINGNFYMGDSEYMVLESCEYFDSFLKFHPYIGIILNIEEDHADYFENLSQIEKSFKNFTKNINSNGYLIINKKINNFKFIIEGLKCNIITFGNENSDVFAKNIEYLDNGKTKFDVYYKNKLLDKIYLNVPGIHNIENALATICLAISLNIDINIIKFTLKNFKNPKRRFQFKGEIKGIKIIDDYAHHPTEIKYTLSTAKKIKHNKIYCVFQPHTFSRTLKFLDEFSMCFDDADKIIILDIYAAREKDKKEIHSKDLVEKIKNSGKEVYYFDSFKSAEKYILNNCIPNDLLITLGAGDVHLLGENILLTNLSTISTDI